MEVPSHHFNSESLGRALRQGPGTHRLSIQPRDLLLEAPDHAHNPDEEGP